MARYRLHGFPQSGNTYKIALYLTCAGLDWELVAVDFFGGETRTPEWRARVNDMGEAPVLEIDGLKLTQSGAILTYLADKSGRLCGATPSTYPCSALPLRNRSTRCENVVTVCTKRRCPAVAALPPKPACA